MTDPILANTIQTWIDSNNTTALIAFVDGLAARCDRAERQVDVYLHEIKRLAQSLATITEPATGKLVTDRKKQPEKELQKHKETAVKNGQNRLAQKPRGSQAVAIDL